MDFGFILVGVTYEVGKVGFTHCSSILSDIVIIIHLTLEWCVPLGGYKEAPDGETAWGLCYNHELSPSQSYCDDSN